MSTGEIVAAELITVRMSRAAAQTRLLRGAPTTLREMILANREIDEAIQKALDQPPVEDDRVPDVILVCPETGDWIPEEDGPGCPHGIPDDCCEPVTFIRAAPNEAAVKEERERIKARIEAVRADAPAWPDDDSYEAGLDAALAAIDPSSGP